MVRSALQLSQVATTSVFGVTIFSADGHGPGRSLQDVPVWRGSNRNSSVTSSLLAPTGTIKNQLRSIRTIPFGRADKLSLQPRISSRGVNQRRSEVPTRWASSLARYV